MKRHLAALALLLAAPAALARDFYIGTLVSSGGSVNNTTTATPFALSVAGAYSLQCDATVYVTVGSASTVTATSAQGVKLAADQLYDLDIAVAGYAIAMVPDSGSANCKVFRSLGGRR